jgi:redox-sensitive bicupin YhaK (pirin superfamily)
MDTAPTIEVRRSGDRFVTTVPGRTTYHSFSFGPFYDPGNTRFGLLVCHNDDQVEPGFGYADHPHRDLEIVTWVLSGALTHRDSSGSSGTVGTGQVQAMSAGSGVVHSEVVEPGAGPTRFVQTWVLPDRAGARPRHATADLALAPGELTPVVSGSDPDARLRIGARAATLYAAHLATGDTVPLPDLRRAHVFVATGTLELEDAAALAEADAARVTDAGGLQLTARAPTELLVWGFKEPTG